MKKRALICALIFFLGVFSGSPAQATTGAEFWAEKYNNLQVQISQLQKNQLVEVGNGIEIQRKMEIVRAQVRAVASTVYKGGLENKVLSVWGSKDVGRTIQYAASASTRYRKIINDYQNLKKANVVNQLKTIYTTNDLLQKQREASAAKAVLIQNASRVPSDGAINREMYPNIPAPNPGAQKAIDFAYAQLGKPYRFATAGPDTYDCSGLTGVAWEKGGYPLVHYSGAQYQQTRRISYGDLLPGDLVFYGRGGSQHVTIYVGAGIVISAPHSGALVRVEPLREGYSGLGRVW